MKILMVMLLVMFILGIAAITIPIVFPSFFFGLLGKFLDWKTRPPDTWDDQ